jgi:hypothetical protein
VAPSAEPGFAHAGPGDLFYKTVLLLLALRRVTFFIYTLTGSRAFVGRGDLFYGVEQKIKEKNYFPLFYCFIRNFWAKMVPGTCA